MTIHTEEQLEAKREAIHIAAQAFYTRYAEGEFENNEDLMFHAIENMYALLQEYRRG